MPINCKNCGHKIIKTETYDGWEHECLCALGSHLRCTFTGDEDQYDECECDKPEPEQTKKGLK